MVDKIILEETEIMNILEDYDLGDLKEFSLIKNGCVHTNYYLTTSKGKFIIRLYEERTKEQITLEMKLLLELEKSNLLVPNIILTKNNLFHSKFNNQFVGVFTFLEGKHILDENATLNQIKSIGLNMGKFHIALKDFKPKEISSKEEYNKNWLIKRFQENKDENPDLPKKYIDLITDEINSTTDFDGLPKGMNHADFHDDNLLFNEDKISGMLDFDDCFYGNLLSDVSSIISFYCIKDHIDFEKCKVFLKSYQEIRKLTSKEKKCLYSQTKMFTLVFVIYWLWSKKNWNDNIKPLKALKALNEISESEFYESVFN